MNIARTLYIIMSYPQRLRHRLGYGVQSPWAYELVRDVFFERRYQYYAYEEQGIRKESDRQLWRIKNRFRTHLIVLDTDAEKHYDRVASSATNDTILLLEHIDDTNAPLWSHILHDQRATVTFDLIHRGVVSFDMKRVKQNYIL